MAIFSTVLLALGAGSGGYASELRLGPALNGGWFDADQPGQGLLVDSNADGDIFFAGWFTYQANTEEQPLAHRWWTIQGDYVDGSSELVIYLTTGGGFANDFPATSSPAGTAHVSFPDCETLHLDYAFDHGEQGSLTMQRLLPVPDGYCDAQYVERNLQDAVGAETPVVFRDVWLVSMEESAPLVGPIPISVLVSDGLVQKVGFFSSLDVPPGAVVIDGRDRYLMPGLVDSHTHLAVNVIELQGDASPDVLERVSTNQLQLYLANGVTTILNLGDFGEPQNRWAAEIAAGERIGPTLLTARYARGGASSCDGGPPQVTVGSSVEAGREYVQEAVAQGYRFVKIYNCTPPSAVNGILAEAAALGISVAGHLPNRVDSRNLLLNPTFSLVAHSSALLWNGYLSIASTPELRDEAVQAMLNGGTALSTTLWIDEKIDQIWCHDQAGYEALLAESPLELMHFTELELHERSATSNRFAPAGCQLGGYGANLAFARDMARRVLLAGGEVLTGTDSPTVFGAAGFSMHSELQALRRAGFSAGEALASATSYPGQYLARVLPAEVPTGRVQKGFRADLLLLDRRPDLAIDDFAASLEMVVARGAVYPRAAREAWLDRIRAEYD